MNTMNTKTKQVVEDFRKYAFAHKIRSLDDLAKILVKMKSEATKLLYSSNYELDIAIYESEIFTLEAILMLLERNGVAIAKKAEHSS